jgi:hypothetical protein
MKETTAISKFGFVRRSDNAELGEKSVRMKLQKGDSLLTELFTEDGDFLYLMDSNGDEHEIFVSDLKPAHRVSKGTRVVDGVEIVHATKK